MKKSKLIFLGFILLIIIFAFLYSKCTGWNDDQNGFWGYLYYSIVTITTLGFGDIYPKGDFSRALTCLEVILGVIIVGVFLNTISDEQAKQINDNNLKNQKVSSKKKVKSIIFNLHVLIHDYLLQCYEVITPMESRKDFPNDIFKFNFVWKFSNMYDMYEKSSLLTNPINSLVIENYFRYEHKLFDELRYVYSNSDISLYPELYALIQQFTNESLTFQFEGSILEVKNLYSESVGSKTKEPLKDNIKKFIRVSDEPTADSLKRSNLLNQYMFFYWHLKELVSCAQKIDELWNKIQREDLI